MIKGNICNICLILGMNDGVLRSGNLWSKSTFQPYRGTSDSDMTKAKTIVSL